MIFKVTAEGTAELKMRWIPERNLLEMERPLAPVSAEHCALVSLDAYSHPWVWCSRTMPRKER